MGGLNNSDLNCLTHAFKHSQMVCDVSGLITNVEARWPGSVCDSQLCRKLEQVNIKHRPHKKYLFLIFLDIHH